MLRGTGLIQDRHHQTICPGCKAVGVLIQRWKYHRDQVPGFQETIQLHADFKDLESFAEQGCSGCRVFRRALYLVQITAIQAQRLKQSRSAVEVTIAEDRDINTSRPSAKLKVVINDGKIDRNTAYVACTANANYQYLNLASHASSPHIFSQIRSWLNDCSKNHACYNLGWSTRNPSWLVQILPDKQNLRLVDGARQEQVDYVALSYMWGSKDDNMSEEEWKPIYDEIRKGKTRMNNFRQRLVNFPRSTLPKAMQDAIEIVDQLGIQYVWIDNVCIGEMGQWEDDIWSQFEVMQQPRFKVGDWEHEALRTHQIYGNAQLTLCVCSAENATQPILVERLAWKYPAAPCTLGNLWLVDYDTTLNELRLQAPIFRRGWILQEERLSPRILYWCGQRVYWACSEHKHIENLPLTPLAGQNARIPRPLNESMIYNWLQDPQAFLQMQRRGDRERLHREWLHMVRAFTGRNMFDKNDKFPAMSGLAAQYLWVFKTQQEEYLAGLWRTSLAQDLAWSVVSPGRFISSHQEVAPSWSWASLPFECQTRMEHDGFRPCKHFELLDEPKPFVGTDVLEACRQGAKIRQIKVRGRHRRLLSTSSRRVRWADIAINRSGRPTFNLKQVRGIDVFTQHTSKCQIAVIEGGMEEVVGQFDYQFPWTGRDIIAKHPLGPSTAEASIECLELGEAAMMLLIPVSETGEHCLDLTSQFSHFRRVGVAFTRRMNFFDSAPVGDLILV